MVCDILAQASLYVCLTKHSPEASAGLLAHASCVPSPPGHCFSAAPLLPDLSTSLPFVCAALLFFSRCAQRSRWPLIARIGPPGHGAPLVCLATHFARTTLRERLNCIGACVWVVVCRGGRPCALCWVAIRLNVCCGNIVVVGPCWRLRISFVVA